jgi:hypothetical protein
MLSQKRRFDTKKTFNGFTSGLQRSDSAFPRRFDHDFVEVLRPSLRNYNHDTTKLGVPVITQKMSLARRLKLIPSRNKR